MVSAGQLGGYLFTIVAKGGDEEVKKGKEGGRRRDGAAGVAGVSAEEQREVKE